MPATIRLMRMGKRSKPFYRIVVLDKRRKQVGSYIEHIGSYNPLVNPPAITVDEKKLNEWTAKGAIVSEGMGKLLKYLKKTPVKKD